MAWGYWFDPDLSDSPEPREKQLELADWIEIKPRVWERRVKEWERRQCDKLRV